MYMEYELIVTQWDVNIVVNEFIKRHGQELIVTQWDVNKGTLESVVGIVPELIVTQWDVNFYQVLFVSYQSRN